jgi:hypothetical protein
MSSKTPFEIRTELLSQAQSILTEKRYSTFLALENYWSMKREEWSLRAAAGDFREYPPFPTLPAVTTEDIIAEARKLNDFVSNG